MSRIFNDSFDRVVRRIEVKRQITSNDVNQNQPKSFEQVLGDLEKTNDLSKLAKSELELAPRPAPNNGLTNLTYRERAGMDNAQIADIPAVPINKAPSKPPILNVKMPMVPVKTSVEAEILPDKLENTKIPASPQVVDIRLSRYMDAEARSFSLGDVEKLITNAGKFHGVDPTLSMAIAKAESSFNPHALSNDGFESKGLFQLLDSTGQEMMGHLGVQGEYEPYDPAQNSMLGVGYFRHLLNLFSTESTLENNLSTFAAKNSNELEKLAVAAFNAGQGRVARAQNKVAESGKNPSEYSNVEPLLPQKTREYVARVLDFRSEMLNKGTDKINA